MKRLVLLAGACVLTASHLFAQAPQGAPPEAPRPQAAPAGPRNLQVLPKMMGMDQVAVIMKGISMSLGVTCDHCHVMRPGPPAPASNPMAAFDFAADDKPQKKIARIMMSMTSDLNTKLESDLGKPPGQARLVQCLTCHRGQAIPTVSARTP